MAQRYDVFLSYSHKDRHLAERISRRLRTYRPPRRSGLSRRLQVFRDVERLTAGSSLNDLLFEQISSSRHLVLLASPDSKNSEYVAREVETFLAENDASLVRIVLLRGEFEDSLPAILRELPTEPLYIDLRETDRKRFRLETLRLIASLHGVDYANLRREDEARGRQRLFVLVAGLIGLVLLVASGYLIVSTPSEAWEQIPQPVTETWSNALMPVEQVAIQRNDPNVVVWLGRNALHADWLDNEGSYWKLLIYESFSKIGGFSDRADEVPHELLGKPILVLTLAAEDGRGETLLKIDSRIFALSDADRTFFASKSNLVLADGNRKVVPLTETEPYRWLDGLEPEPAGTLRKLGYSGRDLAGQWIDYTEGGKVVEAYFQGDWSSEAREVLDATVSPEFLLFSNDEDLNTELKEKMEVYLADDLWSWDFVGNENWLIPTLPHSSTQYFTREEIEESGLPTVTKPSSDNSRAEDEFGPDAAFLKSLGTAMPVEFSYRITTLKRPDVAGAIVEPLSESHEVIKQPAPILLSKAGEEQWHHIILPTDLQRSKITDVLRSQEIPSLLFLVTDSAGVFRSLDSGVTWEEVNLGEAAFRQASETKLILAPGPTIYALALLHEEPGDDLNPLFRLEERSWFMRWRIGLAAVLSGASAAKIDGD